MTCPECELNKARAALWRHEAYKLGGTPLPWDVDVVIARAVAAEREACAKVCDSMAKVGKEFWNPEDAEVEQGVRAGAAMCAAAIRSRQ